MRIVETKAFKGRNIYSHQKVVKMILELEPSLDKPTKDFEGLNEKLLSYFPDFKEHYCSKGYPGGFVERLQEGTYLPHVIEHLALEVQHRLGYEVSFGKARQIDDTIFYNIIFAYKSYSVGMDAGKNAVEIIDCLINGRDPEVEKRLLYMKEREDKTNPGPSTRAIIEAAAERGIAVTQLGDSSIFQLGYGKYQKRVEATIQENTSCIAVDIACEKGLTKSILSEVGLPVPEGSVCTSLDEAIKIAETIGYPIVVKPESGNQGKGVSLNLISEQEVEEAFYAAACIDENVIVEKHIKGKDYRVLVVGDSVVAVAQRIPAHVTGDGVHSIEELVEIENQNPNRGEDHEKPLTKIKIDNIALSLLRKQGYSPDDIPKAKEIVYLKANGNISTGGIAIDCTDKIHPFNYDVAIRAARAIGLDVAGIDITCPNIGVPIREGHGAVIEVNAAPGIRMHLFPSKGKPRNVGKSILDMLYPPGSKFSIPIVSITGTNGKTTTTRLISHILRVSGLNVGMTTTGGVYINDKCILKGDTTGPASAKTVLMDRNIDAAVLETARGGIIRSGLGYDLCDVGVLTNISSDHLGMDGIYSLEDLVHVKSLVIESIKSNGYAVLNADDPMVIPLARKTRGNVIYFSKREDNLAILKHLSEGGVAVFLKGNYITISTGETLLQVADINQVPASYGGRLVHNIENCLAAVGAAYGLKVPIPIIEKGLYSFHSDEFQNPGRFNIYNIRDFRVVIDYGHNIAGYQSVINAIQKMGANRLVGIIGVPGDRDDQSIQEVGKIAGEAFHDIIIKEDVDLRGRAPGQVSALLKKGIMSSAGKCRYVDIILSEINAFKQAIQRAQPGDLIVVFYEELQPLLDIVHAEMFGNELKESNADFENRSLVIS